ncbi:MAG: hypothetical protein NC428_07675 [Clostridium sp.]|nr:hypothetical protein [Clostridium sp.]
MTDKILDVLQAALEIFCSGMETLYGLLTIDPVTYQGGVLWDRAMQVYAGLVGVGFTIILVCGYLGIIGSLESLYDMGRQGTMFAIFTMVTISGGLLSATPYILRLIIKFCQDIIAKAMGGRFAFADAWQIPNAVLNATQGLSTLMTVILWLICFIGALVIVVSTFTIFLMAYGRIFKMYLYIAIAPLCMSCISSRQTQRVAVSFLKRFIIIAGEGLIIVVALMIFSAFSSVVDTDNLITSDPMVNEGQPSVEIEVGGNIASVITGSIGSMTVMFDDGESNTAVVFKYVAMQSFLFVLLMSIIKGSEREIEKIFGY